MAFATTRRTREIGVRLALGADARRIVALVLREAAAWTAIGLAVGALGARALTGYLEALLFGVTTSDAATFPAVGALLSIIALGGCRGAFRPRGPVAPMLVLRSE